MKYVWVGEECGWGYWEPVVVFQTEAQARRWERRKRANRMIYRVPMK
jgi:hypothetical protein